MNRHPLTGLAALALASAIPAQNVCEGNGSGQAFLEHTPVEIGGMVSLQLGSPAAANGVGVLSLSDGFGPTVFPHPLIGNVCLDVMSAGYVAQLLFLDGSGNAGFSAPITGNPAFVGLPPIFANALAVEGTPLMPVFSISKTVRLTWENKGGYRNVSGMQIGRSLHRATSLSTGPRDNRTMVLVTGGGGGNLIQPVATNTTDLYVPLERRFIAGPNMASPRAFHTSTMLQDGRVLITGGTIVGGMVTPSCEVYDPATNSFTSTAPMNRPRAGHPATLLPDGRVLVSGGLADYVNPVLRFGAVLNSAQDTAEVYDPTMNSWTLLGQTMASPRSGHAQVLLSNGTVLLIAGINGAVPAGGIGPFVPTYTSTCEVFDPATNGLSPSATIVRGRAFFGASRLGNDVLISGGIVADPLNFGAAIAIDSCELFNGTSWSTTGAMAGTRAFHTQVTSPKTGLALIHGGLVGDLLTLSGTADAGSHDGTTFTPLAQIGTNPGLPGAMPSPRGYHTLTLLYDGTWLLAGGTDQLVAATDGFVYIE